MHTQTPVSKHAHTKSINTHAQFAHAEVHAFNHFKLQHMHAHVHVLHQPVDTN